jgi:ribosomal protein L11 methyltransferase
VIRLAIRVRREDAEIALAELLALAPSGVEETDLGDAVEYAVYGAPGELPALPDLQAAAGDALVEVVTTEVPDDWAERWRAFHRPVDVGVLHVRPPWCPPPPAERQDIVIDPGQAFGTGAHATTRLCLELLLGLPAGGSFADLGCGSGVLAIAAARLGFAPVLACDHDPAAVAAATANAAANGVGIAARRADLRRDPIPSAPVVVANLVGPLLLELAPQLAAAASETLIVSGLLATESRAVAAAFADAGLAVREERSEGEWAALALAAGGAGGGSAARPPAGPTPG